MKIKNAVIVVQLLLLSVLSMIGLSIQQPRMEAMGPEQVKFAFELSPKQKGTIQLGTKNVPIVGYLVNWSTIYGPKTARFDNINSRNPILIVEEFGTYIVLLTAIPADIRQKQEIDELRIEVLRNK